MTGISGSWTVVSLIFTVLDRLGVSVSVVHWGYWGRGDFGCRASRMESSLAGASGQCLGGGGLIHGWGC